MTGKNLARNPVALALGMFLFGGLLAVLPFLKGGLYLGKHEGDTLHLMDVVLRMAQAGQMPHFDFTTPIGIGATWPIAVFVEHGLSFGLAVFAAQATLFAVLFLPILWVARTRFPGGLGWALAFYIIVLCLAIVFGNAESAVSISMHYNRWAWALVYIAVPLAMMPSAGRHSAVLDGVVIGVMLAGMALIKVTYFVAFLPAIIVALVARRAFATLGIALAAGVLVAAILTALLGVEFWLAYIHDLLTVAGSKTRAAPGESLVGVLTAPAYLGVTFCVLAGVVLLRQGERMTEGMVLLFLMPGFVYVTYQNYGNDPQWLVLLGLLLLVLRPAEGTRNGFGWDMRQAVTITAVAALVFATPSVINMAWSPFRHFAAVEASMAPFLTRYRGGDQDVFVVPKRVYEVVHGITIDSSRDGYDDFSAQLEPVVADGLTGQALASATQAAQDRLTPALLNGAPLPKCELVTGYNAWFESAAQQLQDQGFGTARIFVADLFSALWLYGDFPPLNGAAPWYYSGLPGLAHAEYVLVPICPTGEGRRKLILQTLEDHNVALTEVARTSLWVLLRPDLSQMTARATDP
ncbi:hypothetical protein BFP70_07120 [Thioclava sp. SK-1]|uniref:hypothetical protein n=1 Tax=Thioclava sp. SK-1 TaxID=1889770 RepID=UPI0008250A1D|nr:hypothetical protein [Thioclava sp. SK-1]OCX65898.1 hypothetical protein BFP70_07120 [Thioclava sp. SK-1]